MLTISGRSAGSKRPLFADFSVPPPPDVGDGGPITLRQLIATVVVAEVGQFKKRQQDRRLDRVMTRAQIDAGAAEGRIDPSGKDLKQRVSVDEAIGTALLAFEDGLYLVVVDEQEQRDLNATLFLRPDSRVTFIRLVFLAGA